jgi:hypothetical protein
MQKVRPLYKTHGDHRPEVSKAADDCFGDGIAQGRERTMRGFRLERLRVECGSVFGTFLLNRIAWLEFYPPFEQVYFWGGYVVERLHTGGASRGQANVSRSVEEPLPAVTITPVSQGSNSTRLIRCISRMTLMQTK